MRPALSDDVLWAACSCGEAALTAVLFRKRRWREYPAFTSVIALQILTTAVLLPLLLLHDSTWYGRVYRVFSLLDVVLQFAIVVESARIVLRPTGTWVRDARRQFLLSAIAGTLLALFLACTVVPPAPTRFESFNLRANLFTSLLICELFIAVTIASNRLGLGWRNHVMAIGQGFIGWSIVATVIDSLHTYYGATRLSASLESVQSCTYLAVLCYWSVQLWKEEPERQPISPELRKFILALHDRVQYDLGEAER